MAEHARVEREVRPGSFTADFDAPAGTPIYFHVQKACQIVEFTVTEGAGAAEIVCAQADHQVSRGLAAFADALLCPPCSNDT